MLAPCKAGQARSGGFVPQFGSLPEGGLDHQALGAAGTDPPTDTPSGKPRNVTRLLVLGGTLAPGDPAWRQGLRHMCKPDRLTLETGRVAAAGRWFGKSVLVYYCGEGSARPPWGGALPLQREKG